MGATAVVAMADSALASTEPATRRPLHPFFAQSRNATVVTKKSLSDSKDHPAEATAIDASDPSADSTENGQAEEKNENTGSGHKKRRQVNIDPVGEESKKPRSKKARTSAGGGIADHFTKLGQKGEDKAGGPDADGNPGVETLGQVEQIPSDGPASPDPKNGVAVGTQLDDQKETKDVARSSTTEPKPKTSTIGPPPKPKEPKHAGGETAGGEKKAGAKRGRKPASKVVIVSYGSNEGSRTELGKRIDYILSSPGASPDNSKPSVPAPAKKTSPKGTTKSSKTSPKQPRNPAPTQPAKSTHPFFLGKVKKQEPTIEEATTGPPDTPTKTTKSNIFTSTPISPPKFRLGASSTTNSKPQFGTKNLVLKFPGAELPAWPWNGMVHVRGEELQSEEDVDSDPLPLALGKSKYRSSEVFRNESILSIVTKSLDIPGTVEAIRNIDTENDIPPPPELRLPQKHFESGSKLQSRVLQELRTFRPSLEGKNALHRPKQLERLFDSVRTSLSAFDKSQCETANWVQKYAPTCASEVLQPGKEAYLLRDWLKALTVESVDTGATTSPRSKKQKSKAGKNKRRKRLDGFIVSSDDENYELNELSEDEADWAPSGSRGIIRKTVIKPNGLSKDGEKIANTLVISGPHGCGKTAAVYAVANELGFEVFEINSCSRRSGRDLLAKIGNMTKNHHVNQRKSTNVADDEVAMADEDTTKDIVSGKQSTMAAFCKPKATGAKPKNPVKAVEKQKESKESPKSQRQSLILLEEADILFLEDKNFWAQVVDLIAESKRPFVVTCNDEILIPLHTLRLHGIFRLSLPPRDLAIDRLLLVAANEGHALRREAVETLYDSRNYDLRGATMDLQYWCQIGVGDRRGGFDWFYLRWPKGIDLDENNEVVRVISQDTYVSGMNLLARDRITGDKVSAEFVEQELIQQTWGSWGLDIASWEKPTGPPTLQTWAESLQPGLATPASKLAALEAFDDMADAMSAADICSMKSFAAYKEEIIDATQPDSLVEGDLIVGLRYLDTPRIAYYDSLATDIPSAVKSFAKSTLREYTETVQKGASDELRPLNEKQTIDFIQSCFTDTLPGTPAVARIDFAFAFDPIATEGPSLQPTAWLDPSVFDRTLRLIALDVAPFVRGIVAYDVHLQKERLKRSNLLSEGGQGRTGTKRMRTTRAALSALEGGTRSMVRGEKWFKTDMNTYLVAKTGGAGWNDFEVEESEASSLKSASIASWDEVTSPDASPVKAPLKKARRGRPKKKVVIDEDADEF
ncbi:ATPase family AAA domain-containing protein 5 [Podospora fimiseda]|uniref:ATPase family AAA domain-containing protein 5 n=1 Tax=Podospora fimiseda TaxID=252190 RepID=A0AAN7H0P1_9PEZI|nr:ATPase family AAA domain-containing protein 5 [Podospora fimiseda]